MLGHRKSATQLLFKKKDVSFLLGLILVIGIVTLVGTAWKVTFGDHPTTEDMSVIERVEKYHPPTPPPGSSNVEDNDHDKLKNLRFRALGIWSINQSRDEWNQLLARSDEVLRKDIMGTMELAKKEIRTLEPREIERLEAFDSRYLGFYSKDPILDLARPVRLLIQEKKPDIAMRQLVLESEELLINGKDLGLTVEEAKTNLGEFRVRMQKQLVEERFKDEATVLLAAIENAIRELDAIGPPPVDGSSEAEEFLATRGLRVSFMSTLALGYPYPVIKNYRPAWKIRFRYRFDLGGPRVSGPGPAPSRVSHFFFVNGRVVDWVEE